MVCNCGSGTAASNGPASQLSPAPDAAGGTTPDGTPKGQDGSKGGTVPYYSSPGGAGTAGGGSANGVPYTANGSEHAGNGPAGAPSGGGLPGKGGISAKLEGQNPGAFNLDPNTSKGYDYGTYQINTGVGTMNRYLASMQANNPEQFAALQAKLPEGTNLTQMQQLANSGDPSFVNAWKSVSASDPTGLQKSQDDFIQSTHYDVSAAKIQKASGLDINQRGLGVQQSVWAMSVQMGPNSAAFTNAFAGKDTSKMSDADVINALEDEHQKVGTYFPGTTNPRTQQSIVNRVAKERGLALGAIGSPKTPPSLGTNDQIGV